MAIRRLSVLGGFEYTTPQQMIDAPPTGCVYVHLAWFHRRGGRWIGEWAGYVPAPDTPLDALGDERVMNTWLHEVQRGITPFGSIWQTIDQEWDIESWDATATAGAVCLDVARFGWPVGDHRWNIWNDTQRLLDWPESSVHRFIEVQMDTMEVIANQSSHRPVRPGWPGRLVLDITGSRLEPFHGEIFGRFVRRDEGWYLDPCVWTAGVRTPRQLTESPIDLDLFAVPVMEKVAV